MNYKDIEHKVRVAFTHRFRLDPSNIKALDSRAVNFKFDNFKIVGYIFSRGVFFTQKIIYGIVKLKHLKI